MGEFALVRQRLGNSGHRLLDVAVMVMIVVRHCLQWLRGRRVL